MKQHPEHFESDKQQMHRAPETLIPNVLAQLGLESTYKNGAISSASLQKSLQANDWQTRLFALEAFHRQSESVPPELLVHLLHDEDASVRASAVRLLSKIDDSTAMSALETALHDPNWHVRETAVFALGQHISPPINLLLLAQNDEDSSVREAAAHVLREVQTEEFTMRSLTPDEVLQAQPNSRSHTTHGYMNNILQGIQNLGDRLVPNHYTRSTTSPQDMTSRKKMQRPVMRVVEIVVAAMVVLGLAGSWFALTQAVHTSTQNRTGTARTIKGRILYHQNEMTPAVYWTSNSKYVYISDKQNTLLHFINVVTKEVTTIANPDVVAQTTTGKLAALTPDGLSVCTVDNTGSALHIRIQSVLTNKTVFDASYPKIAQSSTGIIAQWSNDGTRIALSSDNGIITIANVTKIEPLVVLQGVHTPAKALEWSHDDRQLLSTTADGIMQAWNTLTTQRQFVVTVRSDTVSPYQQAFSPDGKYIAIVPNEQSIQILDAATGKVVLTRHDVMSPPGAYYLWLDNTHIVSYNEIDPQHATHTQVWDVNSNRLTLDIPLPAIGGAYTTYAGRKYIVTPEPNHTSTFQVWDALTSHKIATHTSSSTYAPLNLSPNGKYFIITAGGGDNKIDMWSATTGRTVALYYGSDKNVMTAQYSPDGKYLLSLSTNGTVNPVGSTLDVWQVPA